MAVSETRNNRTARHFAMSKTWAPTANDVKSASADVMEDVEGALARDFLELLQEDL